MRPSFDPLQDEGPRYSSLANTSSAHHRLVARQMDKHTAPPSPDTALELPRSNLKQQQISPSELCSDTSSKRSHFMQPADPSQLSGWDATNTSLWKLLSLFPGIFSKLYSMLHTEQCMCCCKRDQWWAAVHASKLSSMQKLCVVLAMLCIAVPHRTHLADSVMQSVTVRFAPYIMVWSGVVWSGVVWEMRRLFVNVNVVKECWECCVKTGCAFDKPLLRAVAAEYHAPPLWDYFACSCMFKWLLLECDATSGVFKTLSAWHL